MLNSYRTLNKLDRVFYINFLLIFFLASFTVISLIKIYADSLSFGFDLMEIAWKPGRELMSTGSLDINYPYPIWTVIIMMPFALLPSDTASIIWLVLNLLFLSFSIAAFVAFFDLNKSPIITSIAISFSLFYIPVLHGLGLGQLTFFLLFILVLVFQFFLNGKWNCLGITLGLSFLKPQVLVLPVALILLWALWNKKWATLISFSATITFLFLISMPFVDSPWQIIGGGIGNHILIYINNSSTLWGMLMGLGLPLFIPLSLCIVILVLVFLLWLSYIKNKTTDTDRLAFLTSISVVANLIILPYGWSHNFILLLFPFWNLLYLIRKTNIYSQVYWMFTIFGIICPLTIVVTNFIIKENLEVIPPILLMLLIVLITTKFKVEEDKNAQHTISR